METRSIFVLIGLLLATSVFAQAYRWVDEDGVVHFSDVPREGAEEIDLAGLSRATGARVFTPAPQAQGAAEDAAAEGPFRYESISIASPGSEETLWNIEGQLNVSVALSPGLQSGHQMRIYFDGQPQMVPGTSFQLEEVWRGSHNLQAEVLDQTGKVLIRSKPSRFYVQQTSVITRRGP